VDDRLNAPPLPQAAPPTESDTGNSLCAPEVATAFNLTDLDICLTDIGGGGQGPPL
jgi:hypothetical protein